MGQNLFYICNIIAENKEDSLLLKEHLGRYPINILEEFPTISSFEIPTIVVGWDKIKERYPKQNIFDKKIEDNLFWSFSFSEDDKSFYNDIEDFFQDSVKKWLPKNFIHYDSLFNTEDFLLFFSDRINKDLNVFVYFNNGAMYLRNGENNFIVNVKSLLLTHNNFKKEITCFLNSYKIIAFSYKNFCDYIDLDTIGKIVTIENIRWVAYGIDTDDKYFDIIPGYDLKKYTPFLMSKIKPISLDSEEKVFLERMSDRDLATYWMSTREIALSEDFKNIKLDLKVRKGYNLAKIEYSNKRTITGRVVAVDKYNPQNLQRDNQDRANIITRFDDGFIIVYDYVSFETRIALLMCQDESYINKYHYSDLHYEVSKIIFERNEVSEEEREFCKILNHSLLYGAGEDTLLKKLSIFNEPSYKLYQIRQFLAPLIKRANEIKEQYNVDGRLINEWGSIIRTEKAHAGFNNYMQSIASEIIVDKVWEVRKLLKNKLSVFLFQVHDSLVFDIHPNEKYLIEDIKNTLSVHKNMEFTTTYKIGKDYKNLF